MNAICVGVSVYGISFILFNIDAGNISIVFLYLDACDISSIALNSERAYSFGNLEKIVAALLRMYNIPEPDTLKCINRTPL